MKKPKVLWFVNGYAPTKDEHDAAMRLPFQVCFRNANAVGTDHTPEQADAVGGAVPKAYSKFASIDELVKQINGEVTKTARKAKTVAGEKVAPVIVDAPTTTVSEVEKVEVETDLAAAAGWSKN